MPGRLRTMLGLLIVLAACLAVPAFAQEPDPYLDFAQSLFDEGDYYRAVTEAKRFLFLQPDHPRRVEAQLLIARSHMASGEFPAARTAYRPVVSQKERPDLAAEALLELGRCLERIDPGDALAYYKGLQDEPDLPASQAGHIRNAARYRLGWLLMDAGRWAEARRAFESVDEGHDLRDSARQLALLAPEGETLPYRSPTAAGALSAVLPGAGQLYVNRPVDAGLAFGLNAAFLLGSIEAYQNESWAVFGLLGLMELSWYGGNIYNAVNGAHIHNRQVKDDFIKKLDQNHGWRMGYSAREQGLVLSWTTRY